MATHALGRDGNNSTKTTLTWVPFHNKNKCKFRHQVYGLIFRNVLLCKRIQVLLTIKAVRPRTVYTAFNGPLQPVPLANYPSSHRPIDGPTSYAFTDDWIKVPALS